MSLAGPTTDAYRRGPHAAAMFAAAFTGPLLFVGGMVTTYRVGMAVPDWPTTFGINMFLFDFWNTASGIFIEHTHRLYASAVGGVILLTAIYLQFSGSRRAVKVVGWLAAFAVLIQGLLGGLRVLKVSTDLAAVHGCFALALFGLLVALVVLTGRPWIEPKLPQPGSSGLRSFAIAMPAVIYGQVLIGAWLRHYGEWSGLVIHAVIAPVVWGAACVLAWKILRKVGGLAGLRPAAWAVMISITIQVALGIGAWWLLSPFDGVPKLVTMYQAMIRTGHQTNAGLLLGSTVWLALRASMALAAPSRDRVEAGRKSAALEEALA